MSQTNVIITSGTKNQIIRVPVVTSSTGRAVSAGERSAERQTAFEIVTSTTNSATVTLPNRCDNNVNHNNSDIKTIYYNRDSDNSFREHLLLPTDSLQIKEEHESQNNTMDDEMDDYESMDEEDSEQLDGEAMAKSQFVCSGCGKGFCYSGWLDRHRLASPECRHANAIKRKSSVESADYSGNESMRSNAADVGPFNMPAASKAKTFAADTTKYEHHKRPSLEGRLSEPIYCPNQNCSFSTFWVQSLNKHVSSSCKFGRNYEGSANSGSTATATASSVSAPKKPTTCHLCSKVCVDIEDHIQHMKSVHQLKHLYKCSECSKYFSAKHEVEAHIADHNKAVRLGKSVAVGKLLYRPINAGVNKSTSVETNLNSSVTNSEFEQKADENQMNGGQSQVWHCKCGKTYLSLRSYEIHCVSCEKSSKSSYLSTSNNTVRTAAKERQTLLSSTNGNNSSDMDGRNANNAINANNGRKLKCFTHFRREQIEAIHTNDFRCRYCKKQFSVSAGLCNHLSRRPDCREWYYKNLPLELQKVNSFVTNDGRAAKRARTDNRNGNHSVRHQSSFVRESTADHSLINSQHNRQRRSSLIAKSSHLNKSQDSSDTQNSGKTSAHCVNCHKEFIGKNPNVALTNHLRGSTCTGAPDKSNLALKFQRKRDIPRNSSLLRSKIKSSIHGMCRYYCKLCRRKELKNRVSLGCHLTIYHGLPQVNVTTSEGDAYRCQTCNKVFVSKYFYNLHRTDCDMTSPYVGVIGDYRSAKLRNRMGAQLGEISDSQNQFQSEDFSSDLNGNWSTQMVCNLCKKTGFSNLNAIKIHQKYQCVKRYQVNSYKRFPSYGSKRRQRHIASKKHCSELAKLNDMAKNEPDLTRCDTCGRGPYNSYYYLLEHKRKFCQALKGIQAEQEIIEPNSSQITTRHATKSIKNSNTAKKSLPAEAIGSPINEPFCLSPTIPRARKTMNSGLISPQLSRDSVDQHLDQQNADVIDTTSVSQIIKCSLCKEEFDDTLQFIRHRLGHLTQDIMNKEPSEQLECELCDARVVHYQRIQQHLILHLQNVQITKKKSLIELSKRFHYRRNNSEESDEEETGETVLHCPYCNAEYTSGDNLANHIKNTCPFRYQCANCNNTYSTKESYTEHKDECLKNNAANKTSLTTFKCRNCSLEFKIKQQLLWHEHACNKVYTADYSGRVEEVILRTLACSVCGMASNDYEAKVKHESKCLKRYLAQNNGNCIEDFESEKEPSSRPLSVMDFDIRSLSNLSQSTGIPEELMDNLRHEFGIHKEVKVVLTPFSEEKVKQIKADLYSCEKDETNQFEELKQSFIKLVNKLIKDTEILEDIKQGTNAETLLSRMLKYLGEEPIEANGLNELSCFRQNLQTFLKLTIKDETLILAYSEAESVDEAIINMLNFKCELH